MYIQVFQKNNKFAQTYIYTQYTYKCLYTCTKTAFIYVCCICY